MKLTMEERDLMSDFLFDYLDITERDGWPDILDWLRQVEQGEKDFFLEFFSGDKDLYNLLEKVLIEDKKALLFIVDADALIRRVEVAINANASERVCQLLNLEIENLLELAVDHFHKLSCD